MAIESISNPSEASLVPNRISRLCKDFEKLHCPYLVYELHIQNFHVIKDLKREALEVTLKNFGFVCMCGFPNPIWHQSAFPMTHPVQEHFLFST